MLFVGIRVNLPLLVVAGEENESDMLWLRLGQFGAGDLLAHCSLSLFVYGHQNSNVELFGWYQHSPFVPKAWRGSEMMKKIGTCTLTTTPEKVEELKW